ncbi:MAG: bifunctional 3,4-dihydroxy-2-butanone-4-phosphate synthase/GTP cyclohydrolase II [Vampirovibrionales bacterium]|nr:bifunctional 3,4-dihydroxy-2-butanone-4-phosphate synthase/GTP cyclohydrolase II [Vampirovibrionales bacterium]
MPLTPSTGLFNFDSIEDALIALKAGRSIILVDDEDRENEGDLVALADRITPETINFMAVEGRGLICLALTPQRCQQLDLPQMVTHNEEALQTAFTVSIDGHPKYGITTGISASDRAKTIQLAVARDAKPNDLRRPGHIFPLRAKKGGVLERVGHTEASVDLARLAGAEPAGVICEIMNEDGTMARRPDLELFAQAHNLPLISIAQLVSYRLATETTIKRVSTAKMPTRFGEFEIVAYENTLDDSEHVALVKRPETITNNETPLVRVHSECLTGDLLGSLRCDCGFQLHGALEQISAYGHGALVYLRQHEGRGIGLNNKIKAYALQDEGLDTVEANHKLGFKADLRQYGIGAQIIRDLGFHTFDLLTNNPRKIRGLDGYGLEIRQRVPLVEGVQADNLFYLQTKKEKLGHLMENLSSEETVKGG